MKKLRDILSEEDIQFKETSDNDGYHTHIAKKGGIELRIRHYIKMIGNRANMNTSFEHIGDSPKTAHDKSFVLHAVRQSTNKMIKKYGINTMTYSSSSPRHDNLYDRFIKSKGGKSEYDGMGKHKADLD